MGGLPIRTFHEHRKGIEEMFGVIIECDKSKGYIYYIKNPEVRGIFDCLMVSSSQMYLR